MKDYYRILGVKETASWQDIRARWIELMRKLHPDRKPAGEAEDPKLREINEAYAVLKHSSTRIEYDLKRAYDGKKRGLFLRRVILSSAILMVLLILGFIGLRYVQGPRVIPLAKSSLPSARGFIYANANRAPSPPPNTTKSLTRPNKPNPPNHTNLFTHGDETNQTDQIDQINQIDQTDQIDQIDQTDQINQMDERDEIDQINGYLALLRLQPEVQTKPALSSPASKRKASKQTNQIKRKHRRNQTTKISRAGPPRSSLRAKAKTRVPVPNLPLFPDPPKTPTIVDPANQIDQTDEIDQIDQINQIDQTDETDQTDQIDQTDEIHQIGQTTHLAQLKPPAPAMTEEEVSQFLEQYERHYVRQDIEAFLSLFSLKAVQNGSDGFDEIRKAYSDFFHQSHQLRYHLEDIRIHIYHEVLISGLFYENAVVAEARYRVDQILLEKGEQKVWRGEIRWILVRENGALKILYLDFASGKSR